MVLEVQHLPAPPNLAMCIVYNLTDTLLLLLLFPPSCLRYMKYVHFSSSISGGYVLSASLSTTKPVSMP